MRTLLVLALGAVVMCGCYDNNSVAPRDTYPPAAPRGVRTVTGDHEVLITWLANTEADLASYRVYISDCPGGPNCLYQPVGSTQGTSFVVTALQNGTTRYFDVSAVDAAGNESAPSSDIYLDTPRPAGTGLVLSNYMVDTLHAGYDFGDYAVVSYQSQNADIVYGASGDTRLMIAPFTDTSIQDAGYAVTLDAVDYAPLAGWALSRTVELTLGHCYIVRVRNHNYAKFRVTSVDNDQVVVDWAYQTDPDNRELRARPASQAPRIPRAFPWPVTALVAGGG